MTVLPRSYSRQIGATWWESETGTAGKRSRRNVAHPQLVGRVDVGEEEADGDRDVRLRVVRDARARLRVARSSSASSVSGISDRPWKSRRSATPRQLRRSTSGSGFVHFREKWYAIHALDVGYVLEPLVVT